MASNMKAVKLRIKSVQNTMQITKAMELVASSKLRKAKERADRCRPYFKELHSTLQDIADGNTDFTSIYAGTNGSSRRCYVVIGGDRGLAGGYNSNMFKYVERISEGQDYCVLPIGKKAVEYYKRRGADILTEAFAEIALVSVSDCFEIARLLCKEYKKGEFGHIDLCYTTFVSMLSQTPASTPMLPLSDLNRGSDVQEAEKVRSGILFEPDEEEVFDAIVPEYIAGLVFGAVCDSEASELAARRNAMESATDNAEQMIEELNLYYNRARQASITQEITEIVGGAEGL